MIIKPMKRILLSLIFLLSLSSINIHAQTLASYGAIVTSLNSSSAGAVTGTSFAIPLTSSSLLTWTITSDSAVLSTILEGSVDNSSWFTIDSNSTTGIKNYGFTSVRFARISQVSRTGGTTTTGTIVTSRAFNSTAGNFTTLNTLSVGNLITASTGVMKFGSSGFLTPDVGISRMGVVTIAIGNGTQGDFSGTLTTTNISLVGNASIGATGSLTWNSTTRSRISSTSDGIINFSNVAATIGSNIKVDALPTIASGFGTSPSITAGSTPFAGSVNVGTGAAAAGVINFNGTAFPSAPFCVVLDDSTVLAVRATATTTQLTITPTATFTAGDVISWICVSSK
jgi:hypothetical protein